MLKRNIIIIIVIAFFVLAFARFFSNEDTWLCQNGVWVKHGNPNQTAPLTKCQNSQTVKSSLSEAEARVIAEKSCIKGGEALSSGGTYNENSKTWWFDANLNATQTGCHPACVVFEETKATEINWRCTGLIEPVACTMDAKQCPDGSYVGRTPPKCEFVCPK